MQPITKSVSVPVEAVPKSRLEQAPFDVKLTVLKGLSVNEVNQMAVLNKTWQKVASDKRVWVQVAKQLQAPSPSTNDPKKEVLNFYYKGICKLVASSLSEARSEGTMRVIQELDQQWGQWYKIKDPREKYAIALRNFRESNFVNFLWPVTEDRISAIKQFVDDGVLVSEQEKILALGTENREIFQYLVNKLNGQTDVFNRVLESLVGLGPYDKTEHIKILIQKGARPTARCLEEAEFNLGILLDYCPLTLREEVLKNIPMTGQNFFGQPNSIKYNLIKNASPPTYGGQVKSSNTQG